MTSSELPSIPVKKYFTIGEASKLCTVKPHVLRYWEQEFSLLSPGKRRGNRRYYQRQDIIIIREIRSLLYDQGFTISGARKKLSQQQPGNVQKNPINSTVSTNKELLSELELVLKLLK